MNTDKMIPIDFSRNITPFVPGDVYYNNFLKFELTMDQQDADGFNKADPKSEFNTYFIVSFADRPNTGTQPVGNYVIVDIETFTDVAVFCDWASKKPWKPNHAAMLAKFKEQGANTVRQYNDQEAELATHFSGNNNRFYIKGHTMIRKAMVLNDDGRWIYSDCTTNAELDGDEFWKLDYYGSDQVIEPWVGDQLTEQKESACPGKPVFTQEMCEAGDKPKAMMECLVFNTLLDSPKYEKAVIDFIGEWCCVYTSESCRERSASVDDLLFKPIDNRTDDQKAYDDLYLGGLVGTNISKAKDIIKAIKAGKITGVKWSL